LAEKSMDRPFAVTALLALVLTFTAAQILGVCVATGNLSFYSELELSVHPAFFIGSGLVWGGLGLWSARGLWRAETWTPKAMTYGALAFAGFSWFDRLVLQVDGPQRTSLPFDLIVTAAMLVIIFSIFRLPRVRAYFGEMR
jgi:hypothetical protein